MSDTIVDHNVGEISIFVFDGNRELHLKVIVRLKKYTKDSSSTDSHLFGHSYGFLGDVEEGCGEIIKFDFDMLEMASEVNM